jgi:hypothetical protein
MKRLLLSSCLFIGSLASSAVAVWVPSSSAQVPARADQNASAANPFDQLNRDEQRLADVLADLRKDEIALKALESSEKTKIESVKVEK